MHRINYFVFAPKSSPHEAFAPRHISTITGQNDYMRIANDNDFLIYQKFGVRASIIREVLNNVMD